VSGRSAGSRHYVAGRLSLALAATAAMPSCHLPPNVSLASFLAPSALRVPADYFAWVLAIFFRKFLVAISSLAFSQNPTFALSAVTLILFGAYTAQVRCVPYMSTGDYESVLADHAARAKEGNVTHAKLAAALAGIETRGRKRTKVVNFSREGLEALRSLAMRPGQAAALAGGWLYNCNTVEATMM
jgi:hypothetical protein